MSFLRNLALTLGFTERRRDGRTLVGDLDVSYWTGVERKRFSIRDISPTGVYLHTDERWMPGTSVLLTMQRRSLLDRHSQPEVRLQATVVRLGADGVGLTFVQDHIDMATWLKLMSRATELIAQHDAVRVFRVTKALAFLLRISPGCEDRILKLITEELSHEKAEIAIEMVLKAEEMLLSQNCAPRVAVSPSVVLRILETGSALDDEQVRQWWTGLLAAAPLDDSEVGGIQRFVDILSDLDGTHVRIFMTGCTRAMQIGWKTGFIFPETFYCTPEEIKRIAGAGNTVRLEQDLNRLSDLGLLQRTVKRNALAPVERANITPTALGLALYARCTGQTDLPETLDPAEAETAD